MSHARRTAPISFWQFAPVRQIMRDWEIACLQIPAAAGGSFGFNSSEALVVTADRASNVISTSFANSRVTTLSRMLALPEDCI